MRIGIDFCRINPKFPGGMHNFALGLTKGLLRSLGHADSIVIITTLKNELAIKALLANQPLTFKSVSLGRWDQYVTWAVWVLAWALRNFRIRSMWDRYFRARAMREIDACADVIVVPTAILNFYELKTPSILCVHDIQQEYHPELFSLARRIVRWGSYRASCWRAESIQASSEYIKNCLIEKFKFVHPGKIFIAREGVDLSEFSVAIQGERPEDLGSLDPDTFVFYPAQLWRHKNHVLLIDALASFRNHGGVELPCVLTGYDYGIWKTLRKRIERHGLKCVYYLGHVNHSQIQWLYGNCRAVLALGFHESSSLPVREGAAFGKPLICANIPPNVETQEALRLRLVDKDDPSDLTHAFAELVEDREDLQARSLKNVNLVRVFDWTAIAKKYISVAHALVTAPSAKED